MSDPSDKPSEEPEEIASLSASEAAGVMDALDRNRNKILIGVGGAAVIICAILVGGQLKKQAHLEAATAYSEALEKKQIASFDGVVVDYPGSIAAGNALLSKAELQIDQGKPADAKSTIERFINEFAGHPRYAQGVFSMGNLYHISGDREKAAEYYERTLEVQPDGELSPLVRIRLGDLALEAGETEAADQNYQESYSEHPGNPFFAYAEEKIALLAVGNPPVVKRPEPEPEPEPEPQPAEAEKKPGPGAGTAPPAEKAKAPAKSGAPKPAQPKAAPGNGKAKAGAPEKAKPSAPKASTPKADAPKPSAPKPSAPKPSAPKPSAPKPSAPKGDAPKAPEPGDAGN